MDTAIYISDDFLCIDGHQNYAIPKSHLANVVTRFCWVKSLLRMEGLSKADVLLFLDLAEQMAPQMRVEMPDMTNAE